MSTSLPLASAAAVDVALGATIAANDDADCWAEWESACLSGDRQTDREKSWCSQACGFDVAGWSS